MLLKAREKFWTPQNIAPYFAAGAGGGSDPFWANVVLLMGFEGTNGSTGSPGFTDESSKAHGTATVTGASSQPVIDTAQFAFGSSSAAYPTGGTTGRATFADSADWHLGAGLFTIDLSYRPSSITGGANRFLLAQWDASPNLGWVLFQNNATLNWDVSTTGSNTLADIASAGALGLNIWNKIAIDYDGTKYRLYLGGVMVGSSATARTLFAPAISLGIGNASTSASAEAVGWIDELRITKGIARYASDSGYTVATGPFPRTGPAGGPTVDATATGTTGAGNTSTVTITTTQPNCLIFVCDVANFSAATNITGISGSTLGAFTKRFDTNIDGGWGGSGYFYWKLRPTAGTETITITYNGTISYSQVGAISVAGANTSAPFAIASPGISSGGSTPASITTPTANTLAIGFMRMNSATSTPDAGYTAFCNTNFMLAEYKALAAAGAYSITDATSGGGLLLDAITA